jgi:hypothetical protein
MASAFDFTSQRNNYKKIIHNRLAISARMVRLIATFYKNYFLLSMVINFFCLRIAWINGLVSFFGIFWGKIATLIFTYFLVNSQKQNEYYYYQNLGISKLLLWVVTLSFDFLFFLFLVIVTQYIR